MDRYRNRQLVRNNLPQYESMLKERGRNFVVTYSTEETQPLSDSDIREVKTIPYRWGHADKFYKLAAEYYGDVSKWWIIAWYNQTPTENHLELGDIVYIPSDPEELIALWGI